MRLLLIEDDPRLANRLAVRLASDGMIVEHVPNAEDALKISDFESFAALIVDIGLPGIDGLAFIRKIRATGFAIPILILTARGNWEEKVDGLNSGADDYVVKPVRAEELIARLNALLRRASGQTGERLIADGIELDLQMKVAVMDGASIELTQIEFRLLQLLLLRRGHILSHAEILDQLYPAAKGREPNTIEVNIARLRRKIGKNTIRTVRGLGYRLWR
ncbi:MAG: response regulator transcription factor [Novosphingobium sp.]|uniref:response regulator transcription factor n=1 Tax=Novosphingobium sp. TaxID=1874826 RepID=UPI0032BBA2ED